MRTIAIALLLCFSVGCHAQEFATRWMYHPQTDTASAVWFRQTYLLKRRPLYTHIAVATTGRFELYINEANVSGSTLLPAHSNDDGQPVTHIIDISRYTRADTLTIAILYAPIRPQTDRRQIAVCVYGCRRDGTPFARYGDGDWLCRLAGITLGGDGAERHDSRYLGNVSPYRNACATACWLSPGIVCLPPDSVYIADNSLRHYQVAHVLRPRYFDIEGNRVAYEFGTGFYGFVRLTLRDARRGERIRIGDVEYICSGKTDEQACARFAPAFLRRVTVEGDAYFSPSQIQRVEGIGLADLPANLWNP